MIYHNKSVDDVLDELVTNTSGLSSQEAGERLKKYGPNALKEGKKKSVLSMIFDELKNPMIIVLLAAGVISAIESIISHVFPTDTIIILFVVLVNTVLGVVQESKAEKSIEALKKMSSPYAKVKRDGEIKLIKSEELVPGDIVALEAGDYVPADLRLFEVASLKCEESALTGESVPVEKISDVIDKENIALGDRKNTAYLGSSISYGRAQGIVTSTGMDTEMGKIAGIITNTEGNETPLQKKLAQLSKVLSILVIIICIVIFAVGFGKIIASGEPITLHNVLDPFMLAIGLAVAAIPEGLATVVTIVLALGVQRMAAKNAIIRKLPAVETLGSTEIICSDKTGTLTQNKMTVKEVYADKKLVNVNDSNYLTGRDMLLKTIVLCNDSKMSEENGQIKLVGDPTETALISYGHELGTDKRKADTEYKRVAELPFDSDRKLMSTVNDINGRNVLFTKGAPDILLNRCSRILIDGNIVEISEEDKRDIENANKNMAGKALRILAAAYRDLDRIPQGDELSSEYLENDLIFVGLVGMIDPARPEVKDAVAICRQAGIRPIMITGDHIDTAVAIAKELGILGENDLVITGVELDKIDDKDFDNEVVKYSVYARVSPENKVKIVKAWRNRGKIVAMTGDGVNDAPALKSADIGVGMGITGTDVSKGVADMVLSDDNFATIVFAVEEGRKIFTNIRKTVQFLLSSNMSEVIAVFVATLAGIPLLHTIQILWVNLVTDTFPALALGVDAAEKDIMNQPPRDAKAGFFSGGLGISVAYQGIFMGVLTLGAFFIGKNWPGLSGGLEEANALGNTMAFVTLCMLQLFHSFNVRSQRNSLIKTGVFNNKFLVGAFALCTLLIVAVITIPGINTIFKTHPLDIVQWLVVLGVSIAIIPLVEIVKFISRRLDKKKA